MKSILDGSFRYTSSRDTDLRQTFARIRREQAEQARAQPDLGTQTRVVAIGKSRLWPVPARAPTTE